MLVDREERWSELRDREETLRRSGRQRDSRRTRDALAGGKGFVNANGGGRA